MPPWFRSADIMACAGLRRVGKQAWMACMNGTSAQLNNGIDVKRPKGPKGLSQLNRVAKLFAPIVHCQR